MLISEDSWHSHLMPSVWQWSRHYLFWRLRYVAVGIRTSIQPSACGANALSHCATAAVRYYVVNELITCLRLFGIAFISHHYYIYLLYLFESRVKYCLTLWHIWHMVMPQHKNHNPGGHIINNFSSPLLGHHDYILCLSDLCPRVEKKSL